LGTTVFGRIIGSSFEQEDTAMPYELPALAWPENALEPAISAETLQYHHGKHHRAYVDNLNRLVEGTELAGRDLEEIVRSSEGGLFNNAAQAWNHAFYWNCLAPDGAPAPGGPLAEAIERDFGSFDAFRESFSKTAATTFGSGWAWLVRTRGGRLEITSTSNAGTPLTEGSTPLLTCDVWEHAYYIDYRNARPAYIEAFWTRVNWEFVGRRLAGG
jgi:Fe-Mn family superoxide dismutase